eukprot:321749-Rhodomonas_salina.6
MQRIDVADIHAVSSHPVPPTRALSAQLEYIPKSTAPSVKVGAAPIARFDGAVQEREKASNERTLVTVWTCDVAVMITLASPSLPLDVTQDSAVSDIHLVASQRVSPLAAFIVLCSGPKFPPPTVTSTPPRAGVFVDIRVDASGWSYDDTAETVPDRPPEVSTTLAQRPVPLATVHRTAESDTHHVSSCAVSPTFPVRLCVTAPRFSPWILASAASVFAQLDAARLLTSEPPS